MLTIWAPKVKTLEITGVLYSKCVLMNILSLINATVSFDFCPEYDDNSQFSGYKLLEDILGQVYHSSRRVEKVTLSDWGIKVLGEMKKKDMLAPLSNLKVLILYASKVNDIVSLPGIFPKLMMLVVEDSSLWINEYYRDIFEILCDVREPFVTNAESSLESKKDFPKSSVLHLTVEIAWSDCNKIFQFVEFLLKHSSKLEKLVLRVTGGRSGKPEYLLLTAEKLLRMPRSSPYTELILCRK